MTVASRPGITESRRIVQVAMYGVNVRGPSLNQKKRKAVSGSLTARSSLSSSFKKGEPKMNECIETEVETKQSFRFEEPYLEGLEQHFADPRKHAEHHALLLDDSDAHVSEYCDLKDEVDCLRKEVDELKDTVRKLDSLINWDNVFEIVDKAQASIPFRY